MGDGIYLFCQGRHVWIERIVELWAVRGYAEAIYLGRLPDRSAFELGGKPSDRGCQLKRIRDQDRDAG